MDQILKDKSYMISLTDNAQLNPGLFIEVSIFKSDDIFGGPIAKTTLENEGILHVEISTILILNNVLIQNANSFQIINSFKQHACSISVFNDKEENIAALRTSSEDYYVEIYSYIDIIVINVNEISCKLCKDLKASNKGDKK